MSEFSLATLFHCRVTLLWKYAACLHNDSIVWLRAVPRAYPHLQLLRTPRYTLNSPVTLAGILYDVLFDGSTQVARHLTGLRLKDAPTHGTGCTLASAVAAYLAMAYPLDLAVTCAHHYVHLSLAKSQGLVIGCGPQKPLQHSHGVQDLRLYANPLSRSLLQLQSR